MKRSTYIIFLLGCVMFVISFSGMVVYGYKTFSIHSPNKVHKEVYQYHFALVAEERDNEYWQLIKKGAEKAAKKNHINLEYVAPKKADNDELNRLFDQMIASKMDGIIIQGEQGKRFKDLVHKSVSRDIPVVAVDTDAIHSERKAYVGTDNIKAGKMAAQTLLSQTSGDQYIGIIIGRTDAINQQQRLKGFLQTIKNVDRIHVMDVRESNITRNGATIATYHLLKRFPKINVLLGFSALDGIGMVEGVNKVAPFKHIYLLAFDQLPETLNDIKKGKIDATIAQFPIQMGEKGIKTLIQLQAGDFLDNKIYTNLQVITRQNIHQLKGTAHPN